MDKKQNKAISRRDFLKTAGAAGLASAGLYACHNASNPAGKNKADTTITGEMTYRTNPKTGDRVSLLGFGMMRLPSVGGRSAREGNEEIDQETVNQLVDYALEHGVNYFDTSPAYCRGGSERATGIALSRHPRNKYFIAPSFRLKYHSRRFQFQMRIRPQLRHGKFRCLLFCPIPDSQGHGRFPLRL